MSFRSEISVLHYYIDLGFLLLIVAELLQRVLTNGAEFLITTTTTLPPPNFR